MVFVDGAAVNKKGRLAEMSRERKISLERNTAETKISLSIDLDGTGKYQVDTGCGFLNHMLELFARHGRFDLTLKCDGDTQVDYCLLYTSCIGDIWQHIIDSFLVCIDRHDLMPQLRKLYCNMPSEAACANQ